MSTTSDISTSTSGLLVPESPAFDRRQSAQAGAVLGRIVVIDDNTEDRRSIADWLIEEGWQVLEQHTCDDASQQIDSSVALVLASSTLGEAQLSYLLKDRESETDACRWAIAEKEGDHDIVVALQNTFNVESIAKPIHPLQLRTLVEEAQCGWLTSERTHTSIRKDTSPHATPEPIKAQKNEGGQFLACDKMRQQIEMITRIDSTVLIGGESGTGKTTVARLIHENGSRSPKPFVVVNCASLPRELIESELFGHAKGAFTGAITDRPGRAEAADGGTLFLDEIGDLPLELQPKLLTFLQDKTFQRVGSNDSRKVDVRLIVATHQDLRAMCAEGRFRTDLYYRLNVLNIDLPPLRARLPELPRLVHSILQRISKSRDCNPANISDGAIALLSQHMWPGNIRELENVLERASAYCEDGCITAKQIDIEWPVSLNRRAGDRSESQASANSRIATPPEFIPRTLEEVERQAIVDTLAYCEGNKALTARTLGISEKSIYNKIKRLKIAR